MLADAQVSVDHKQEAYTVIYLSIYLRVPVATNFLTENGATLSHVDGYSEDQIKMGNHLDNRGVWIIT